LRRVRGLRIPPRRGAYGGATSFNFFSIKIPLKAVYLKKKFTTKANKSKKEEKNEALYRNLFALFSLIDCVAVFFAVKKFYGSSLAQFGGVY
jgi:hypothetical protein